VLKLRAFCLLRSELSGHKCVRQLAGRGDH